MTDMSGMPDIIPDMSGMPDRACLLMSLKYREFRTYIPVIIVQSFPSCWKFKKKKGGRKVSGTREFFFVYYESIKRELKIRCIYECRCDERLQTTTKKFTCLTYTGLVVKVEHLKIETTLIDEKFANAMGE